jgi:SAM-dependent methyltransferase
MGIAVDTQSWFLDNAKPDGRILEQGCYEWTVGQSTSVGAQWFPGCDLVRTDITDGPGVDIPADAHDLAPFADDEFDAVISRSVYEHLARPWIATHAIARVLKPGGLVYIDTHQTFPLHGYPDDYFRFSTDAMRVLLNDAGLEVVDADYALPCVIVQPPEVEVWNELAPSYLHVHAVGRKQ